MESVAGVGPLGTGRRKRVISIDGSAESTGLRCPSGQTRGHNRGMTDPEDGRSIRQLEDTIRTDLRGTMSYGRYLDLDRLLHAQHPRSSPEHHDELLFIVQHQTSELWLKLALHELTAARDDLASDDLDHALKCLARVKNIQRTLIEQ